MSVKTHEFPAHQHTGHTKSLTKRGYHDILLMENHYLLLIDICWMGSILGEIAEMGDQESTIGAVIDRLRELGYRITPQRRAVIEILLRSDDHPSVDLIHKRVRDRFPMTSLATVYKTISLLRDVGEIHEIASSDGTSRYDASRIQPHAHLICTACGKVIDLDIKLNNSRLRADLAATTGYEIEWERHDFFGICPDCKTDPKLAQKEMHK